MPRKTMNKQKDYYENNQSVDKLISAIDKNTKAVKSNGQMSVDTNRKLQEIIAINSNIEYNSYITMDNTTKYNYSKKFVIVWLILAAIAFVSFFGIYQHVSGDIEGVRATLKSFFDLFSNGFVILAILPGTAFISYKLTKESERVYAKRNSNKIK